MADPKSQGGQKRRRSQKTEGTTDRWQSIKDSARSVYNELTRTDQDSFNSAFRKTGAPAPFPEREAKRKKQLKTR